MVANQVWVELTVVDLVKSNKWELAMNIISKDMGKWAMRILPWTMVPIGWLALSSTPTNLKSGSVVIIPNSSTTNTIVEMGLLHRMLIDIRLSLKRKAGIARDPLMKIRNSNSSKDKTFLLPNRIISLMERSPWSEALPQLYWNPIQVLLIREIRRINNRESWVWLLMEAEEMVLETLAMTIGPLKSNIPIIEEPRLTWIVRTSREAGNKAESPKTSLEVVSETLLRTRTSSSTSEETC